MSLMRVDTDTKRDTNSDTDPDARRRRRPDDAARYLIEHGADTGVIYSKKQVYPNPEHLVRRCLFAE